MANRLYYGDNIEVLRRKIESGTIDFCYIDPPFNSKRNYNQIYNAGSEDRAEAQAFIDTWVWGDPATSGHNEILANPHGRYRPQLVDLINGLTPVLGKDSLLAYIVSMAMRITEIHRVLKPEGSLHLHCDPTSSHYLKLVLDSVFLPQGGRFRNEIIWHYTGGGRSKSYFSRKHDVIFWYSKTRDMTFNIDSIRVPYKETSGYAKGGIISKSGKHYKPNPAGTPIDDVWDIPIINPLAAERLGYPTQKPEALLQRLIEACSNEGDTVLDAYCGSGTTAAVAQRLKRRWIGIDITYQSIALVLRRLEHAFGNSALDSIIIDGIPNDMASAEALAHKQDARLRKEFEKWAVLTYTNNRAIINEKAGADGIDGMAYFMTGKDDTAKIIFKVKSGGVERGDIATLRGDMGREGAALAFLITLQEPTSPIKREAKGAGQYKHESMGRSYDKISIVTVREIVEQGKRLEIDNGIVLRYRLR